VCFVLKEWFTLAKLLSMPACVFSALACVTEESVTLFQSATDDHWGADCSKMMEAVSVHDFDRHFLLARTTYVRADGLLCWPAVGVSVVEKTGNVQHCIDINNQQYRTAESYMRAAPPPAQDFTFYILGRASFVGVEVHHQHLQPGQNTLRLLEYAGINNTQQAEEVYRSSAEWTFARTVSGSSADGLHQCWPEHALLAMIRAALSLSLDARNVDLSWLDELPSADAPTLYCISMFVVFHTTARVLVAEVFEQQGRHADAIRFAQTDLQDYDHNLNVRSKVRAGQVLGRCHAALGQHMLSVSAFDAAIELAQSRKLLLSEALSVRGRAAAGRNEAGGSGLHWDKETGKQRLAEVMGRMQGSRELLERALPLPQ
jgi:hypothetical protein